MDITTTTTDKAIEAIRIATGKAKGAFCPGCQAQISERWIGKAIREHATVCNAIRASVEDK